MALALRWATARSTTAHGVVNEASGANASDERGAAAVAAVQHAARAAMVRAMAGLVASR